MKMLEMLEKSIREIVLARNTKVRELKSNEKGFFYSEEDFRVSLIFEFKKYYNKFDVFYEYSEEGNEYKKRIDILLKEGVIEYSIELKYSYDIYGTTKDMSVDFAYDINKINNIVKHSKNNTERGYCILLIKKEGYINKDMKDKLLKLKIEEKDLTLSGKAEWKKTIKDGVEETIEKEIEVTIKKLPIGKYGTIENYHYLIIEISKQSAEKIISNDK